MNLEKQTTYRPNIYIPANNFKGFIKYLANEKRYPGVILGHKYNFNLFDIKTIVTLIKFVNKVDNGHLFTSQEENNIRKTLKSLHSKFKTDTPEIAVTGFLNNKFSAIFITKQFKSDK